MSTFRTRLQNVAQVFDSFLFIVCQFFSLFLFFFSGRGSETKSRECWRPSPELRLLTYPPLSSSRSSASFTTPIPSHPPGRPAGGAGWWLSPSAALDVLLDDHAAVPEERAGQRLRQSPRVGAGVKGLHVAQRRALAAHDAPGGVDLPVQDDGAAERESVV